MPPTSSADVATDGFASLAVGVFMQAFTPSAMRAEQPRTAAARARDVVTTAPGVGMELSPGGRVLVTGRVGPPEGCPSRCGRSGVPVALAGRAATRPATWSSTPGYPAAATADARP